jgi:hypothetical protein
MAGSYIHRVPTDDERPFLPPAEEASFQQNRYARRSPPPPKKRTRQRTTLHSHQPNGDRRDARDEGSRARKLWRGELQATSRPFSKGKRGKEDKKRSPKTCEPFSRLSFWPFFLCESSVQASFRRNSKNWPSLSGPPRHPITRRRASGALWILGKSLETRKRGIVFAAAECHQGEGSGG